MSETTKAKTVATFPVEHRSMAKAMVDQMLAEGQKAWLHLDTGPDLTVSIKVEDEQRQRISR